jgi:tripartite-type tricarboxylate transporter receptor subunit TctC
MISYTSKVVQFLSAITFAITGFNVYAQEATDSKPLRIVVITPPGGQADAVARILSEGLSKSLKRPVIVDNKAGGGGNIATEFVAHQPPDGTNLLLTSNNHTINPTLFKKISYDYQKDFEPVTQLTRGPSVIAAHPGVKAKNAQELVALSKNTQVSYGSTGIGSAAHLAFEIFKKNTGANIVHIPYKGAGPAVADALGGQVQLVAVSLTSAIQNIRAGKLVGLAVTTQDRWPEAPDIPTLVESGCRECVYETYLGLLAPKGTGRSYIKEINEQVSKILHDPATKAKLATLGVQPVAKSPEDFAAMMKSDFEKSARIIKETGMTAD